MIRFSTTAKQLSAEDERLKAELKHIERDTGLVAEERKELDAAILEQTAEMENSRNEAKSKLEETENEIEQLREKLRTKEIEAQHLQAQLGVHDKDINKVLVKFSRQIARVQKKETSLNENRNEWENEQKAYESLKQAHEAEVKAHSEALLQHNELMDRIKSEIGRAGKFQSIVSEEVSFDDARQKDEENDEELAQLQAGVVKLEAAVNEAAALVKDTETALVDLDGERKRLESKIPKLETEKKEAAASRDYKAAAKASKEIKEATARLQLLETELLEEAKDRRKKTQCDLEIVQKELESRQAVANTKEKESGKIAMEKVAEKIRHLLEVKAKECDDRGKDICVKSVAAIVLRGQIHALKLEGQAYGNKFGGWDEIMATMPHDPDEDEDDAEDKQRDDKEVAESENDKEGDDKEDEKGGKKPKEATKSRPSTAVDLDVVAKAKTLTRRLLEAEASLESAVSKEDYESAAELDTVFQQLKTELESLSLTDAETELVISGDSPEGANTSGGEEPVKGGGDDKEETATTKTDAEAGKESAGTGSTIAEESATKPTASETSEQVSKGLDTADAQGSVNEDGSKKGETAIQKKEAPEGEPAEQQAEPDRRNSAEEESPDVPTPANEAEPSKSGESEEGLPDTNANGSKDKEQTLTGAKSSDRKTEEPATPEENGIPKDGVDNTESATSLAEC